MRFANFVNSEGIILLSIDDTNPIFSSPFGYRTFDFYEGMCSVYEYNSDNSEKCGYINVKGEKIVSFKYNHCRDFREGLAVVGQLTGNNYKVKGGIEFNEILYGFIDKNGTLVIPMIYFEAGPFVNGKAKVRLTQKSKMFYINKNGEKVK